MKRRLSSLGLTPLLAASLVLGGCVAGTGKQVLSTDKVYPAIGPYSQMVGYGNYDAAVGALEGWLRDHDYVAGARFTAADVYVGAAVAWGLAFGTMPKRAAFEAYAGRVMSRPAARRAEEIDEALAVKG